MEHISKILPSLFLDVADMDNNDKWDAFIAQFYPGVHLLDSTAEELAYNLIIRFGMSGLRTLVFDVTSAPFITLNKKLLSTYSGWDNEKLQKNKLSIQTLSTSKTLEGYSELPIFISYLGSGGGPVSDVFDEMIQGNQIGAIVILDVYALAVNQERYKRIALYLNVPIIVRDTSSLSEHGIRGFEDLSQNDLPFRNSYDSVTFVKKRKDEQTLDIIHILKENVMNNWEANKSIDGSLKYRLK